MTNPSAAPRRLPLTPTLFALSLLLVGAILLGCFFGDQPLLAGQVARAVLHPVLSFIPQADELTEGIVVGFRLPRVLLAALVGAMLSAAGAALQGLLGNPLADPYTIGVSSGAAVGSRSGAAAGR